MSEYIKTGEELRDILDEGYDSKEQWVSLSWLIEQLKKRRDMFKGLADISELNWVLKLLEMEEKQSVKG
jgi:hypothetical protein